MAVCRACARFLTRSGSAFLVGPTFVLEIDLWIRIVLDSPAPGEADGDRTGEQSCEDPGCTRLRGKALRGAPATPPARVGGPRPPVQLHRGPTGGSARALSTASPPGPLCSARPVAQGVEGRDGRSAARRSAAGCCHAHCAVCRPCLPAGQGHRSLQGAGGDRPLSLAPLCCAPRGGGSGSTDRPDDQWPLGGGVLLITAPCGACLGHPGAVICIIFFVEGGGTLPAPTSGQATYLWSRLHLPLFRTCCPGNTSWPSCLQVALASCSAAPPGGWPASALARPP
ncbi:uncharacterized protein LOC118613623 isoform X2 [Rousettus aegyptiacus]|uniref:uncharacterized protein LOC118613623 isoform X2 n=1 Tax=Rousettus aegyptiacus TaxID=9407 RepID=UPI00168CD2F2|nr:uncharacterized protein LOC118613623 isoform X2 [Rousettus aegyptiacus]